MSRHSPAAWPPHEADLLVDRCRYCGASPQDIREGVAPLSCDISRQVPWSRIWVPVTLGAAVALVILSGIGNGPV